MNAPGTITQRPMRPDVAAVSGIRFVYEVDLPEDRRVETIDVTDALRLCRRAEVEPRRDREDWS